MLKAAKTSTKTPLSSAQRKQLRGFAHHLEPIVQIGKQLLTPQLVAQVDKALEHHELIKVKFLEGKEEKHELAQKLEQSTSSALVGLIGNTAILFRRQKNTEKRKIRLTR